MYGIWNILHPFFLTFQFVVFWHGMQILHSEIPSKFLVNLVCPMCEHNFLQNQPLICLNSLPNFQKSYVQDNDDDFQNWNWERKLTDTIYFCAIFESYGFLQDDNWLSMSTNCDSFSFYGGRFSRQKWVTSGRFTVTHYHAHDQFWKILKKSSGIGKFMVTWNWCSLASRKEEKLKYLYNEVKLIVNHTIINE